MPTEPLEPARQFTEKVRLIREAKDEATKIATKIFKESLHWSSATLFNRLKIIHPHQEAALLFTSIVDVSFKEICFELEK